MYEALRSRFKGTHAQAFSQAKRATSVCGLKLLVYEALSYECMRPSATRVGGLGLLVYEALSY